MSMLKEIADKAEADIHTVERIIHAFLDHVRGVAVGDAIDAVHNAGDVAQNAANAVATDTAAAAHNVADVAAHAEQTVSD